jgi:glucose/arabinose dehydrogenase
VILGLTTGHALTPPGSKQASLPPGTKVETYLGSLDFPVDMAWVPGSKRIFFTEKNTGKVRVVVDGVMRPDPCVNLDVASDGERGALGIALDPQWRQNKRLYVYYTYDPNAVDVDPPPVNRVTRFEVVRNVCTNPVHVVPNIPSPALGGHHNGGQLQFVAGKLFVSTGDGTHPSRAQNLNSLNGKILRYNPDGTIPADNPFDDTSGNPTPVWSYGLRNPFGLGRRKGTELLFASDNGEDCDDELNRIDKGSNYGWGPSYDCDQPVGPSPVAPLAQWGDPTAPDDPVIAPTDLWWYEGPLTELSGDLYMGAFVSKKIYRMQVDDAGTVADPEPIHTDGDFILDVSKGPGGWLYFMTHNAIKRIVPE